MQLPRLENVACPQCGADSPVPWAEENGFRAGRCSKCGLVYVNPRPVAEAISRASVTGMHAGDRWLDETARYDARKLRRTHQVLDALYEAEFFGGRDLRWLDIGCGYGELLEALQSRALGATLVGSEPNVTKATSARSRGLDVRWIDLDVCSERFDVISLVDVYSHLPDPRNFLSQIKKLLSTGGELLLATGNFAELEPEQVDGPLYLPDHLSFSSEALIVQLLRQLSFELVATHRRPPLHLEPTMANRARDWARWLLRPEHSRVDWASPCREIWFRARLRPDGAAQ